MTAAATATVLFAPPPPAVGAAPGRDAPRRARRPPAHRCGGRRLWLHPWATAGWSTPVAAKAPLPPPPSGGGGGGGGGGSDDEPPRPSVIPRRVVLAATAAAAATATAAAAAVGGARTSAAAASAALGQPGGGGGAGGGLLPRLFPRPPSGLGRAATAAVLADVWWPPAFPYDDADWARVDESPDTTFYAFPRFVYHLDDAAVRAQAAYFARLTAPRPDGRLPDVLDLCASWVSFLPPAYSTAAAAAAAAGEGEGVPAGVHRRPLVAGVGLNEEELAANPQLSTHAVLDLNAGPAVPRLPYPDGAFDVVVCAVSIDYLTRPLEVAAELARVLRPGGVMAATFSNRSFGSKAVAAWSAGGDADHIYLVGAVLHYAGGGGMFGHLRSVDLSPPGRGDPLYAVEARRV